MSNLLSNELITELRTRERRLEQRHSVRLVVQKMTADGVNLLCDAWRSGSPLLRRRMDEHELVDLVNEALRSLTIQGVKPLVGVVQKSTMEHAPKRSKTDPFQLLAAMETAGVTELGPRLSVTAEEMERRIALLKVGMAQKA